MATATATFLLNLDSNMGSAQAAAGNLQQMRAAIEADTRELGELEKAMQRVNKGGEVDVAAFRVMQDRSKELKEGISKGEQQFVKLGGSFDGAAAASGEMSAATSELDATTKRALGPLGEKAERLNALKSILGTSGIAAAGFAAAVVVVAAVVVAAAVAIGQLVMQMMQFALTTSDAALKSQIMLEGLTGSASAAGNLQTAISDVAGKSTQSTAEISKLAEGLYKSGLRGAALENAMLKASLAADGLGKNPSADLVARRMANLDVQAVKFKDHIAEIFSGQSTRTAVEKFEMGLKTVADLFDTNTASGKALQTLVSSLLDPLFAAMSAAMPYAKIFFKGMVVGALLLRIGVLELANVFKSWFGDLGLGISATDGLTYAFYAGIVVVGLIAVALGVLVLAALAVGAAFLVAALAVGLFLLPFAIGFGVIVVAALLVVAVLAAVVYAVYAAGAAILGLGEAAVAAASAFISGLAGGIMSGAGAVYEAVKGLAAGAISTMRGELDSHSPSRKLFAIGNIGIAGGLEEGIDAGAPRVNSAMSSLVSIPSAPSMAMDMAAAPSAGSMSALGGGGKVVLPALTVVVKDAGQKAAVTQFYDDFCGTLEELGAVLGIDFEIEGAPA